MKYNVPVIPGDGIGPEIVAEGMKVAEAAAEKHGFDIEWTTYSLGADHYLETGELVTEDVLKDLSQYRAIYLGSIGDPRVKPGVLEKGVLLAMRFYFDQYVNLRPVKLLEGIWTPSKTRGRRISTSSLSGRTPRISTSGSVAGRDPGRAATNSR